MSELHLGRWQDTEYGRRATGIVETEGLNIDVTLREPHPWVEQSGLNYVMANGWTAGKYSMRVPAIEAARLGHRSATFEYSNTGDENALAENVEDFIAVTEATSKDYRRGAIGLSMGGAVVTMALRHLGSTVERATVVAPGKYIPREQFSTMMAIRHFIAEGQEITQIGRHPFLAAVIGATSASNCVRRPRAIGAELKELLTGTVHEDLLHVKGQPDSPFVRFMYGLNDKLLPAYGMAPAAESLPFDQVLSYRGGHGRLAYDPRLSNRIFKLDAEHDEGPNPKLTGEQSRIAA